MRAVSIACLVWLSACSGQISFDEPFVAQPRAAGQPPRVSPPTASERCESSRVGPPLLRRLTRQQIENTYRDAFPQLGADWQGFDLNDVSSALGFSNDADVLVVSPQTSEQLLASAEHVADILVEPARIQKLGSCVTAQLDEACAEQVVSAAGRSLFRRPLRSTELQRYLELFASISGASEPSIALKWTLAALLQSPNTLYRRELGDAAHVLDDYELASELSYTFADSPPDAELRQLAERGELTQAETRVAQAKRLLQSPRGHETLRQFFREWLRYGAVGTADRPLVSGFAAVRGKLIAETERFIERAVYSEEAGLSQLLTAPYSVVDRELAEYYGWSAAGADWSSVTRPKGHGVGVLAQGALLASASNAGATSPTQRGLRVYERLLCQVKPPPPANVPPLESSDPGRYRTTREHYELAHAQGACASCHVQFDPLGFAFEHFDSGGRFRADEAGEPIDASGNWRDELAFSGQEELASRLAESAQVADCVSGLLVQYAFGGAGGETCVAEDARAAFREGASFVDTLAQLAAAEHFARRSGGVVELQPMDAGVSVEAAADSGSTRDDDDHDAAVSEKGLVAQHLASNSTPKDNVIGPYLQIENRTAKDGVALETLELRYYLTNERASRCPDNCLLEGFYAGIHPIGTAVVAERSYVAVDGEHAYLSITFAKGSPKLLQGQRVEVQQQFHTNPYEDFDETNDYSFDESHKTFTDTDKVTIHRDGKRIWGTPPDWR